MEDDAVANTASADDSVVKPSGLQLQAQPLTTPSSASADGFDTEVEVITPYTAEDGGYLSVSKGDALRVLPESEADGDPLCKYQKYFYARRRTGGEGWLPSSRLIFK